MIEKTVHAYGNRGDVLNLHGAPIDVLAGAYWPMINHVFKTILPNDRWPTNETTVAWSFLPQTPVHVQEIRISD